LADAARPRAFDAQAFLAAWLRFFADVRTIETLLVGFPTDIRSYA